MKENLKKVKEKEKEYFYFFNGDKYEGDFKNVLGKEKVLIFIRMVINMKVILIMINLKEKEFYIIIIMVIDMKEILKIIKKMEKEFIFIIDLKENVKMMNFKKRNLLL